MLGNMTELGVTGEHTTDGIPHGSTSLTPFLAIIGAEEALDFYRSVFDARIVDVTEFDGVVVHAELDFGSGKLQVGEPNPEYGLVPPPSEGACYSLGLYCPNVDDVVRNPARRAEHLHLRRPLRFDSRPVRRAMVDHVQGRRHIRKRERSARGRVGRRARHELTELFH